MLEPSKEDFKQCVHDLGTVWSYYPENNYGTQARYGKIGNSLCPFCKFNRLFEDGLKKLDEQNTYFREQANHWNTLAEKVTLENESLKAELHEATLRASEYKTEWESAIYREQGLKAENERLAKESERRKFLLKECEKESKFRGEEIAHLKESRSKWAKQSSENADEVDRLTSALGVAMEIIRKILKQCYLVPVDHACIECVPAGSSVVEGFLCGVHEGVKALSDPSGSVAFEKWKRMGAVVEAARACYEEDDFITENSPGSFERDKKLGEALEALDAKGDRE